MENQNNQNYSQNYTPNYDPNYNQYNYQPVPQYQQPVQTAPQPNILVFGILSLALAGLVGLILGCIGRKKGNEYIANGGTLTGASKVGFILSKAGIIVSIVTLVVYVICIFVIIGIIASGGGNMGSIFEELGDAFNY